MWDCCGVSNVSFKYELSYKVIFFFCLFYKHITHGKRCIKSISYDLHTHLPDHTNALMADWAKIPKQHCKI